MEQIKKIIAKATYGQNTKVFSKGIDINTYERKRPTKILGCIITDAEITDCTFEGNVENGKTVRVAGKFNTHLWYGLDGDTKVAKVSTKFSDVITVYAQGSEMYSNEEIRAWIQQAPKCTATSIVDGREGANVRAQVEYELGTEIVGLTTLNVKVIDAISEVNDFEEVTVEDEVGFDEFEDD